MSDFASGAAQRDGHLVALGAAVVIAVSLCGGAVIGKMVGRAGGYAEGYAAAVDSVRAATDTTAYLLGRDYVRPPFYADKLRPLPSCCGGCHTSWVKAYRLVHREEAR